MPSRSKRLPSLLLLAIPIASSARGKEAPAVKAARESFEKVEGNEGIPNGDDVRACAKAQSDAERLTAKSDRPILQARRAYCDFLGAALGHDPAALLASAAALTETRGNGKNESSAVLKVAAALATLRSDQQKLSAAGNALSDLAEPLNCFNAGFAGTRTCNGLARAAHLWIGYAALNRGDFAQAERAFREADGSPWSAWLTGIQRERAQQWPGAALAFSDSLRLWATRGKTLAEWLGPQPEPGELPARLAYAEVMAGEWREAGPHLDAAIAARPNDARSLYLRSRLRNSLPDLEAAAKAAATPDQSHFYQAILLERRREFPAARREFDAALQSGADPEMRAGIAGWKLLTGAAAGDCTEDPNVTEKNAANAGPLFPKEELASELLDCRVQRSATLEQLAALDTALRGRGLGQSGSDALREHVAAAYNRFGVQAESRKDTDGAAGAYRRALEWSPHNSKARFNLGSLYLSQKRWAEAEGEYRAVLGAEPADREAQFWLAESILGSGPDEKRRDEACGLLQQSIKIQDSAKRDQFAVAFSTSPCAK